MAGPNNSDHVKPYEVPQLGQEGSELSPDPISSLRTRWSRASCPAPSRAGVIVAFARMSRGPHSSLRIDAASCGSQSEAGYANRRRRPAGCFYGDPDGGKGYFSRPSGPQEIAQHRRHPAAWRLCAMRQSGAGRPCPAPSPLDRVPPSRRCDGLRGRELRIDAPLTPSRSGQ